MDTWMGHNSDPITLHKYLYTHADPINNTDPTGNYTLSGLSTALNIRGILTVASRTHAGMSWMDNIINGDVAEFDARAIGANVILSMLGGKLAQKFLGLVAKIFLDCNGFEADTLVHTANGLKKIQDIKIGELVWAYDEITGEKSLQEVVHLIQSSEEKNLIKIGLLNGEEIYTTDEHPFYVLNDYMQWMVASALTSEHILIGVWDNEEKIASVDEYEEFTKVYNLTVENIHTYYVGETGVLTHNAKKKKCKKKGSGKRNELELGAEKPPLYKHKKHKSGGPKGKMPAGLEPEDSFEAMRRSGVKHSNGNWYAKSSDGKSIYRYFPGGDGSNSNHYHWSGSTGDIKAPVSKADIPDDVIKSLGFRVKGPKL